MKTMREVSEFKELEAEIEEYRAIEIVKGGGVNA